ncbi:protein kinase [Lipingzhangella sp. LS1_29]|uniref:Protein kinase n=1 Tax=Lipingzhangella rawalii TaxID=2055835 RepID=A0ABU2H6D1_9ACTN|nr:protein kinase [Lipingzhangella rawalii]MDS1270866.1 protein kinase [Lipingzhangella rawalii]
MADPLVAGDPASLGGYRLVGRLGTGGQGVVYLGQAQDGTWIAIKTLSGDGTADPRFRERFVREAEAARQVASFCTAAVLDVDFTSQPPYIVSEYVDGPSLQAAVAERGPLHGGELHRVAVATATALMAIHEAGIVHRDLKPANVLLGSGGARVIDFGVARVSAGSTTQTNTSIGTPAFMAPEQIAGDPVDARTDVFAWGAVLAFAATGRQPFTGDTVPTILNQVLNAPPDLTGVPEPLHGLVSAALQKNPADRPSSTDILMSLIGRKERPATPVAATQVLQEAAATAHQPIVPAPGSADRGAGAAPGEAAAADRNRRSARRRRSGGLVAAVGVAAFVVGALAGFGAGWVVAPGAGAGTDADGSETAGPAAGPTAEATSGPDEGDGGEDEPEPTPAETPEEGIEDVEIPAELPRFSGDFEGDWIGHTAGEEWETELEADERSAVVEADDADCEYHLLLWESIDQGYRAEVDPSGEDCAGFIAAQLLLEEDLLTIQFFEDGQEEQLVHFERD